MTSGYSANKRFILLTTWILLALTGRMNLLCASPLKSGSLSKEDKKYLLNLARDTYRCIDTYVEPKTGLPYDNTNALRDAYTSVTNIGFYIASVVGAVEFGFEKRGDATRKLEKLLNTLSKLETWKKLPHSWNQVSKLTPHKERFVSTVDLGNYYAGIIVARQYFPELRKQCDQILDVDWNVLYHPKRKLLHGGYNTEKRELSSWYYDYLGADSRLCYFLAIAMSQVPLETWQTLNRLLEERYGIEYLKPGWKGGGLFLGFMSGLFIDERGSLPWLSSGNFAKAQMTHQEKMGFPVWGWSASDSPTYGYLGFNAIRDDIVTPHASALAVSIFPKEVVENLKKLEDMGARPRHILNGEYQDFGFRDALDIQTHRITSNYLILDQTMLFLALTNFLKNRTINRQFESYPPVQEALSKIQEYSQISRSETVFPAPLKEQFKIAVQPYEKRRPEFKAGNSVSPEEEFPTLKEWEKSDKIVLDKSHLESGNILNAKDLGAIVQFLWNSDYLYVRSIVTDQDIQSHRHGSEIYKDDIVEIYINPDAQGLQWGNADDFQIGVSPPRNDGSVQTYAWFQNRVPGENEVKALSRKTADGYEVITKIQWDYLSLSKPSHGQSMGVSVAIHDIDEEKEEGAKLNCYFKPDGNKIELGRLILQ
ncbi:MAG: DUF3131 domain-containing protein [Elusimicrobia bacterium]|nr:DUF3131 domain-containing protein [Elusimicrobiota bacterium]